jgi:polysaccharide chain length determinant protein (PEP-CTERM system associated)
MSVEFRQRTPGDYARIVWRRKWMILLPAVAIAFAVALVVWRLADVYESRTLLIVRPASISTSSIVPQLSDSDLTIRINNIGQEVVSRTSLQPLIETHNLYAEERRRGEPMESLVERMRTSDIKIEINKSRDEITNGFYLSFRARDPRTAQAVAAQLASKYVTAQTKAASEESALTKDFFQQKLEQAKQELDAIDRERLQFMQQNLTTLPSQGDALIGQLSGLREQQKTLITEIGRLGDQRTSLGNLLGDLTKARESEIMDVAEQVGDPKSTLPYAELLKRKTQLEAEKQSLITTFRPKAPEVVAVQNQLDSVQREMNEMIEEGKRKVEDKRKQLKGRVDPRLNSYRSDIARYESEIGRQQKILAQTEAQISDIERRINGVPGSEVGLEALNRKYQSAKASYDDLLTQSQKANTLADVSASAQGESIAVFDAANMPEKPVAPNRPMLMLLGLLAGLGAGIAAAVLFEVPRLLTIQTTEDAEHYTGLPVLVSLPNLLTPREERRLKARRLAFAVAGIAATVVSVPLLAYALKFSRIIEVFAKG